MSQKPALGKGLASLFPSLPPQGAPVELEKSNPLSYHAMKNGTGATSAGHAIPVSQDLGNRDRHPGISLAALEEIQVNTYQPRRDFDDEKIEELAQSIRTNGVIQPLIVRKNANGGYQLIAGERRLRASKVAGLKHVPIVIRRSTDREALEIALIENIQRQDLNCVDEALAYQQLMTDFNLTQEEVAQRVGKDRATVANFLRLLKLSEQILDDLKQQILSLGHAKVLLSLENPEDRAKARLEMIDGKLSVRQAEALVEKYKAAASGSPAPAAPSAIAKNPVQERLSSIGVELTRNWSTRVEVKGNSRRGKIVFHYNSREDLDRMLDSLQKART